MRAPSGSSLLACLLLLAACGKAPPNAATNGAVLDERYWAATPPASALSIKEAKATAQNDKEIVAVGRVGLITERRAQFQLVDKSLTPCNEREGDTCKKPWDY